jgi:hypothetical protein
MKRIYKYQLDVKDCQSIKLPKDARILTVQVQSGVPTMWAIVEPDVEDTASIELDIHMFGTGWELPEDADKLKYIGTVQINGFVWHYFC